MDYGGVDKRRTKKDLKMKRLRRGYKKGGKFRATEILEGKGKKFSSKDKGKK